MVSHGKLKNELRIRAIATNYDCSWTPRMISSTVGMLYRYALHRRAHRLPRHLFTTSFVKPCPLPPQFSQSGAQRLRFTVASRSSARAASAPRPRVRYFRSPARLLAREARFCFESDPASDPATIHSIQTSVRFSERDLHGRSLEKKKRRERFKMRA